MTSKTAVAAELAAVLSAEAHFVQASKSLRPPYYAVPQAHQIAADALALMRIGAGVARWAVRYCNGEGREWKSWPNGGGSYVWGDSDDTAKERADARARAKAQEIADRYGATVKTGGDPRDYTLRLILASGRSNSFAGEGWGVA